MNSFDDNIDDAYEDVEPQFERHRDSKIDEVKAAVLPELFSELDVYYGRQIEVLYEQRFFHWITARALNELANEGKIRRESVPLTDFLRINFYSSIKNRYWKRRANEIAKLVRAYSDPAFTKALGLHGEIMFDAALPTAGFLPTARNVRAYNASQWTASEHDLDRVFERDGIAYGTEVKNTLPYIPRDELLIKIQMCEHLGIRPLFIVRFAPKNYVDIVHRHQGFVLIFKYQLYPHGYLAFAKEIRNSLKLPLDSPSAIQAGTVQRFLNWHLQQIAPH